MTEKTESGEWWTPQETYDQVCEAYQVSPDLDVAASLENSKCQWHFNSAMDALTRDWVIHPDMTLPKAIWCNAPTKLQQKFFYKAYEQWKKFNVPIAMLCSTNTMSSKGFWDCVETPNRQGLPIRYEPIRGRINFRYKGKKISGVARNAYLSVIFGDNKWRTRLNVK